MHSVCCCSLPVWRSSLKKGTTVTYFGQPWIRPLGGYVPENQQHLWETMSTKTNNTCERPWVPYPHQVLSKSIMRFWRRSWKCEKCTDERRRRKDINSHKFRHNSSLQPSAQVSKKLKYLKRFWIFGSLGFTHKSKIPNFFQILVKTQNGFKTLLF